MSLNIEKFSNQMLTIYKDILIESESRDLHSVKLEFKEKANILDSYIKSLDNNKGKFIKSYLNNLKINKSKFLTGYKNFDDKLMIFVVGDGKVGKSTLINALVGYEVAETDFLPKTWKIDIYSPDIGSDSAIVKYYSGREKRMSQVDAEKLIFNEEKKVIESKKKCSELQRKEFKKYKDKGPLTKKIKDEIIKYINEENEYVSDISEVIWGVKKNDILDECVIVDTPGLNQYLSKLTEKGDITNYYYKADGVLWVLDGNVISSMNTKKMLEEIDLTFGNVVGNRKNIIGVINRIDLIEKDSRNKVLEEANNFFSDKFSDIVGLSALKAYQGVQNKDSALLEESGLLVLQDKMRKIFLNKSKELKADSKEQINDILIRDIELESEKFLKELKKYEKIYNLKLKNLDCNKENLLKKLEHSTDKFFDSYISKVKSRVELKIDALGQGYGSHYVIQEMYKLDELKLAFNKYIGFQKNNLDLEFESWADECVISEYKYIKKSVGIEKSKFVSVDLDVGDLSNLSYFSPKSGEGILVGLGNAIGGILFNLRKSSIQNKIVDIFSKECNRLKEEVLVDFSKIVDEGYKNSKYILNGSFEKLLCPYFKVKTVEARIEEMLDELKKEKEENSLANIIL